MVLDNICVACGGELPTEHNNILCDNCIEKARDKDEEDNI